MPERRIQIGIIYAIVPLNIKLYATYKRVFCNNTKSLANKMKNSVMSLTYLSGENYR